MKKSTTSLLIVIALVLLSFVLNPSADRHRTKIKEVIAERSRLEKALGVGQMTAFASKYHSIGVASYTTVNDKVQSVGVLGMVFVAD